jgi:hypothetical protein
MRGDIMIPKLGSITLAKQKRRTDVLEQLNVRERPLRHGHNHDWKKVIFLLPFVNLTIYCNGFKGSYECICYLLVTVVFDDEINIDALDGFAKGMPRLHPKPEGEDPECLCVDICKMEVSGDYMTF